MVIDIKLCWSCGQAVNRGDRYCQNCKADTWNPPQGANAALLAGRPAHAPQAQTSTSTRQTWQPTPNFSQPPVTDNGMLHTVAAAVSLLAVVVTFGFWFSATLLILAILGDEDAFGVAIISGADVAMSLGAAIVLTIISWKIARGATA